VDEIFYNPAYSMKQVISVRDLEEIACATARTSASLPPDALVTALPREISCVISKVQAPIEPRLSKSEAPCRDRASCHFRKKLPKGGGSKAYFNSPAVA